MTSEPDKLLKRHQDLTHTDGLMVTSHVQRPKDGWYVNTVMVEGHDVPFKYKRQQQYKSLQGQRVNMTYYPTTERVGGLDFEVMKVVRIRRA